MKPEELLRRYNAQKNHFNVSIDVAKRYLKEEVLPDESERNILDGFTSYVWLMFSYNDCG